MTFKCKNCGNLLNEDDNFCKVCGAKTELSRVNICINCGNTYEDGDNFCKKCGFDLRKEVNIKPDFLKEKFAKIDNKAIDDENEIEEEQTIVFKDEKENKSFIDQIKNLEKKSEEKNKVEDIGQDKINDYENANFDYRTDYDHLYDDVPEEQRPQFAADDLEEEDNLSEEGKSKKSFSKFSQGMKKFFGVTDYDEDGNEVNKDEDQSKYDTASIKLEDNEEVLNSEGFIDRTVLSDEKKKLIEESRNKDNYINHDKEELIKQIVNDSEMEFTQRIRLDDDRLSMDDRRVISKRNQKNEDYKNSEDFDDDFDEKPKKSKLSQLLIPLLSIIAVFSLFLAVMFNFTDKKHVVADFEKAINESNTSKIKKYLLTDKESISDLEIEAFAKLQKDDQLYKSQLIGAIKEDSSKLTLDKNYKSQRPYRLEKVGKLFLLFPDYKIVIDSLNLRFDLEEPTNLSLAGVKYDMTNRLGVLLIPGIYQVDLLPDGGSYYINLSSSNDKLLDKELVLDLKGIKENPIDKPILNVDENSKNEEIKKENPSSSSEEIDFKILTEDKDAKVFVNDKNTGLNVEEYNKSNKILKEGDKIKLSMEYPWGQSFSEEYLYEKSDKSVELVVKKADMNGASELIIAKIEQMLKEDEKARQTMDTSAFTTLLDPRLSEMKDIIARGKERGMEYYRKYNTISYDLASMNIKDEGNGNYSCHIAANIAYEATEYPKGQNINSGYEEIYYLNNGFAFNLKYSKEKNSWFVSEFDEVDTYLDMTQVVTHELGN